MIRTIDKIKEVEREVHAQTVVITTDGELLSLFAVAKFNWTVRQLQCLTQQLENEARGEPKPKTG